VNNVKNFEDELLEKFGMADSSTKRNFD